MTCRFVDLIKGLREPAVIDIGAGYGVASLPAMEAGAYVIVNDIERTQLDHVAELARENGLEHRCKLLSAALPNLPEVPPLDAVHASNVLHFLNGEQIGSTADWMHGALKPGGKVFIQMQSPYCGHFQKWPGEIEDARRYAAAEICHLVGNFSHVLEADIAAEVFLRAGFSIDYADYYTRPGLPEVSRLDGRENLGLVAVKRSRTGMAHFGALKPK